MASGVSVAAERESIQRQGKELQSAAEKGKSKLKALGSDGLLAKLYSQDKTSSAFQIFAQSTMRELCKSYRQLNATLSTSDRLSSEGKALLDNVKQLLSGKDAKLFAEAGLKLDRHTGDIKFDENKFVEKAISDPAGIRKLLLDKKYLGPAVSQVVDGILNQSTDYFFNQAYRQQSVDLYA